MSQQNKEYNASSISVLRGIEAVRKRPGMYIGRTDKNGVHHLFKEIFDNAVDEALAGHCTEIVVKLLREDMISISDNGRGIPIDIHPIEKVPASTLIFTELHAGGKFDSDSYKVSGGLHGVGSAVTNALSEFLEINVNKNGKRYNQKFKGGLPDVELHKVCDLEEGVKNGTEVIFKPDPKVFKDAVDEGGATFDIDKIKEVAEISSILIFGLKVKVINIDESVSVYESENGILDIINDAVVLKEEEEPISHEIIHFKGENKEFGAETEVAMYFLNRFDKSYYKTYVNNIETKLDGKHVIGFRNGLSKVLSDYAINNGLSKEVLNHDDILKGAYWVVSLRLEEAEFDSQTKLSLSSSSGQKVLYALMKEKFNQYLEENPDFAKSLVEKSLNAKRFREKQEKMLEDLKKEESKKTSTGTLPGKLADCRSKDIRINELFIVEGDSAGGSAKSARNSLNQAILPLKGKILNVLKADLDKTLKSKEIQAIKTAMGAGFGHGYSESKIRYGKTIILTDADDDGLHIATLLFALYYKFMPEYIREGRLYVAKPPLYKVVKKSGRDGKASYYYNDEDLSKDFPEGFDSSRYERQRFKGLGEMNASQLKETTMLKGNRSLIQVVFNEEIAERVDDIFEMLLGDTNDERKEFFMNNSQFINEIEA